jgi:hypothetical protein
MGYAMCTDPNNKILQADIEDVISDKHGHKVLLHILSPFNSRYFTPELVQIMKPRVLKISKRIEPENEGEEATTIETQLGLSKKDEDLRRREILKDDLWKTISATVSGSAAELVSKQYASDVVVECCIGGDGNFIEENFGADSIDIVHGAILNSESLQDLMTDYFASRAIRRIIMASKGGNKSAERFAKLLWTNGVKGKCKTLKDTHAAKIVAALVESGCPSIAKAATAELKKSGERDPSAWAGKYGIRTKAG